MQPVAIMCGRAALVPTRLPPSCGVRVVLDVSGCQWHNYELVDAVNVIF